MRFMTDIILKDKGPHRIPTSYRIDIASLMKEGMKNVNPDLYYQFWGNDKANVAKPYTFCVYIPEAKHIKGNDRSYIELNNDRIYFTFSSNDPAIVINFYNIQCLIYQVNTLCLKVMFCLTIFILCRMYRSKGAKCSSG